MKYGGYSEDLAFIHAEGFEELAESAAAFLLGKLRAGPSAGGLVIDVGCGSGRLASRLLDAGYEVLGIDISEPMVRIAREREPRGTFEVGSFATAELPPCVAVVSIGECLSYLFDEGAGEEAVRRFVSRAHAALLPGGCLLFDVLENVEKPEVRQAWRQDETGEWAVLVAVRGEPGGGLLRREITSFRRVGDLYRRTHEVHVQRRFDRRWLKSELEKEGFSVRVLRGYGQARFRTGQVGFLATKR